MSQILMFATVYVFASAGGLSTDTVFSVDALENEHSELVAENVMLRKKLQNFELMEENKKLQAQIDALESGSTVNAALDGDQGRRKVSTTLPSSRDQSFTQQCVYLRGWRTAC